MPGPLLRGHPLLSPRGHFQAPVPGTEGPGPAPPRDGGTGSWLPRTDVFAPLGPSGPLHPPERRVGERILPGRPSLGLSSQRTPHSDADATRNPAERAGGSAGGARGGETWPGKRLTPTPSRDFHFPPRSRARGWEGRRSGLAGGEREPLWGQGCWGGGWAVVSGCA